MKINRKIAIIQPRIPYYIGGGEIISMKQIKELSRRDIEIDVYTWKIPKSKQSKYYIDLKKEINNKVNFIEIEIPRKYKYIFKIQAGTTQTRWDSESILFSTLIQERILEEKYTHILSYYILDGLFKDIRAKNILYILGVPKKEIKIYEAFLNFFDITISNSSHVLKNWKKQLETSGKSKNIILPTFSIEETFDFKKNKYKNNIFNEKQFNIVFAGRLIKRKGVDILIKSIKKSLKKNSNIFLHILGDGPEFGNLEKMVQKYNLNKNIKFYGYIEKDIEKYFYFSDLVIFPSREGEGFMGVVQEAMSVKSCVITTKNNGNEEMITNNKTGYLVKADANELSLKINELFEDRKKILKIKENAYTYAKNNFSIKKWADEFIKQIGL